MIANEKKRIAEVVALAQTVKLEEPAASSNTLVTPVGTIAQ